MLGSVFWEFSQAVLWIRLRAFPLFPHLFTDLQNKRSLNGGDLIHDQMKRLTIDVPQIRLRKKRWSDSACPQSINQFDRWMYSTWRRVCRSRQKDSVAPITHYHCWGARLRANHSNNTFLLTYLTVSRSAILDLNCSTFPCQDGFVWNEQVDLSQGHYVTAMAFVLNPVVLLVLC